MFPLQGYFIFSSTTCAVLANASPTFAPSGSSPAPGWGSPTLTSSDELITGQAGIYLSLGRRPTGMLREGRRLAHSKVFQKTKGRPQGVAPTFNGPSEIAQ